MGLTEKISKFFAVGTPKEFSLWRWDIYAMGKDGCCLKSLGVGGAVMGWVLGWFHGYIPSGCCRLLTLLCSGCGDVM